MKPQFLIDRFGNFWTEREPRERRMLSAGAAVVAAVLIYLVGFAPALQGTSQLQKALPDLRLQAASLQALAREAQALGAGGGSGAGATLSTQESVEAGLTRKGLKAQSIVVTGDLVRVQMNNVSFAGILDWLDETQKGARLSVVESSFTALTQTDMVNATLSLRQPKTEDRP